MLEHKKIRILIIAFFLFVLCSLAIYFLVNNKIQNINNLHEYKLVELQLSLASCHSDFNNCQQSLVSNNDNSIANAGDAEMLPGNQFDLIIENELQDSKEYLSPACPLTIEDMLIGEKYIDLNGENYSKDCQEGSYYCNSFAANQPQINNIISDNEYNIVNGCIYKNKLKVFNYNLANYYMAGFFGLENIPNLASLEESFRFEHDGKLFIFLRGHSGNSRPSFLSGLYLSINLATGLIEPNATKLPQLLVLSPDKKKSVEISFDYSDDKYETSLYLFDLIDLERKQLLFNIPSDKTILSQGDGVWPVEDAIEWINGDEVKIHLYEKGPDNLAIEMNGDQGFIGYVEVVSPKIVNIE